MLKLIFFDNWKKILFVYSIVLLETSLFSFQPSVLGWAVDDLVVGETYNIITYSIFITSLLAIGTIRRVLDTRIYISIWKDAVLKAIEKMRLKNVSSEKIFARYNLTNYYVDAFEIVIPHMIKDTVFCITGIVMIFFISHIVGVLLLFLISVSIINYILIGKINVGITLDVQQGIEETQQAIEDKTERTPINKRGSLFIKRSDWDAYSYGINELCWIIASVISVLIVANHGLPVGEIMATILYVDRIFISSEGFSSVISHWNGIVATNHILEKEEN